MPYEMQRSQAENDQLLLQSFELLFQAQENMIYKFQQWTFANSRVKDLVDEVSKKMTTDEWIQSEYYNLVSQDETFDGLIEIFETGIQLGN